MLHLARLGALKERKEEQAFGKDGAMPQAVRAVFTVGVATVHSGAVGCR
jgi:hypothetical protein